MNLQDFKNLRRERFEVYSPYLSNFQILYRFLNICTQEIFNFFSRPLFQISPIFFLSFLQNCQARSFLHHPFFRTSSIFTQIFPNLLNSILSIFILIHKITLPYILKLRVSLRILFPPKSFISSANSSRAPNCIGL